MSITSAPRPSANLAAQVLNARSERDRNYVNSVKKMSSEESWQWYDELPEIHFGISRSARVAGYARFAVAKLAPNGEVVAILEDGPAAEIVAQISSPFGGTRHFIERFYTQRKVPGDSMLIRLYEGKVLQGYQFISQSELEIRSDTSGGTSGGAAGSTYAWRQSSKSMEQDGTLRPFPRKDLLGRVWSPHPRYFAEADSPLMAMETECDLLRQSTKVLKAKMMNRLMLAGILYIASEIQTVAAGDRRAVKPDEIVSKIIEIMTANIDDPESGMAVSPILMRGPAQFVEAVKFIAEERDIYENDIRIRAELIDRILFGLDLNKTSTTGEAQNRFQAWSAADDDRRIAVQPDLEDLAYSLNKMILWPQLRQIGWKDDALLSTSIIVMLDKADIRANRSEDARQALDRVLIGDSAGARDLGYGAADLITGDERVRRVGVLTKNPVLALYGTPEYDLIDWDLALQMNQEPGPTADSPAEDPAAGPGDTGGGPDDSDPQTPAEDDDPRDD